MDTRGTHRRFQDGISDLKEGMKMVSNPKYLLTIGDTYYFRFRVPKHIRGLYSETQIKKSLQTKDLKLALHKATILKQLTLLVFKQLEEEMIKKDKAKAILFSSSKKVIEENPTVSFISQSSAINNSDNSIPPAGDYGAYKAIERQNKAVAKAIEETQGSVDDLMSKLNERLSDTTTSKPQSKLLVKDLLEKFITEKLNDGSWDETTKNEYKPFLSLFEELQFSGIQVNILNRRLVLIRKAG